MRASCRTRTALRAGLPGAALISALSSCYLFAPGAHVLVQMPEPPPHWLLAFPDLRYIVEYTDPGGRCREATAGVGEPVSITCGKEQNAPILAWPCRGPPHEEERDLFPAGGFFPSSLGEGASAGVLSLRWEDGCAALLVKRLRDSGRDVGLFNVERLVEEMRGARDPWSWDADAIAQGIAAGDFSAYSLDRLACRDVTLDTGPGEWFLESPLGPLCPADSEGITRFMEVPLGSHVLFSARGARRKLFVAERETVVGPPE